LQLKGGSTLNGNIQAGKLQIEPTANFNGECHMTAAAAQTSVSSGKTASEVKKEYSHVQVAPA
jgi:cytoskeletal protein CcmA (bactofilin family)